MSRRHNEFAEMPKVVSIANLHHKRYLQLVVCSVSLQIWQQLCYKTADSAITVTNWLPGDPQCPKHNIVSM